VKKPSEDLWVRADREVTLLGQLGKPGSTQDIRGGIITEVCAFHSTPWRQNRADGGTARGSRFEGKQEGIRSEGGAWLPLVSA
jgi:hypothetical protein